MLETTLNQLRNCPVKGDLATPVNVDREFDLEILCTYRLMGMKTITENFFH
jgi:hypothetical protein